MTLVASESDYAWAVPVMQGAHGKTIIYTLIRPQEAATAPEAEEYVRKAKKEKRQYVACGWTEKPTPADPNDIATHRFEL